MSYKTKEECNSPVKQDPNLPIAEERSAKRILPDEEDPDSVINDEPLGKKRQVARYPCGICKEHYPLNQFPKASANCKNQHGRDACQCCWRRYFKIAVMERKDDRIPCISCGTPIDYEKDFKRIMGKEEIVVPHYDWRRKQNEVLLSRIRECNGDLITAEGGTVPYHNKQKHDPLVHGRVFRCNRCGTEECTSCNIREHHKETCSNFQARMLLAHDAEEAATAALFVTNLKAAEGPVGARMGLPDRRRRCPTCGIMIERAKGAGCDVLKCAVFDENEKRVAG